jgi:hypothetical protein
MLPEFSVQVAHRRWPCVLDPALALATPHGGALVRGLGALADVYMVRAFFTALDSSDYYVAHPAALVRGECADTIRHELLAWERIRARTDLTGLRFFWIGDNQSESRLPGHAPPDLVQRYERLCDALSRRPPAPVRLVHPAADMPLMAAAEVAALACALEPALVLTTVGADASMPALCRELASLGVECQAITPGGNAPLAALERDEVRALLVHAGATPLFCAGLRLAVVHVIAPEAALLRTMVDDMHAPDDLQGSEPCVDEEDDVLEVVPVAHDWWSGARAFWYPVVDTANAAAARAADA